MNALRVANVMVRPHPGEAEMYYELRATETSKYHAEAFDELVVRAENTGVLVSGIDIMWTLSFFESAKRVALEAINETRGSVSDVGTGFQCTKCGLRHTVASAEQTRAGDEATKLKIKCVNPRCGHVDIVG